MAQLRGRQRASLPDTAFAYIDSRGRRRLPIHDEAHVRNALARFGRVAFENDAARERARRRLLAAAKKHGIVPIGFIDGQLRSERERLQAEIRAIGVDVSRLPTGRVTFLLTDIEGSTGLLRQLGDRYEAVLRTLTQILRSGTVKAGGREVEAHADEFFAAFGAVDQAVAAALSIQRALRGQHWPDGAAVAVRIGVHTGQPTVTETGYLGLAVHEAARVCSAAHGGQVLLSDAARSELAGREPEGIHLRSIGSHGLHGLPEPMPLFQLEADGLTADFPPPRTAATAFAHLATSRPVR